MKCSEVTELLKSDYLDGEVSPEIAREVETHLALCVQCRKLEQELVADRGILKQSRRFAPPERVWQNIRASIASESEEAADAVNPGVIERLKLLIWPPKPPVFAWSGALTILIAVAIATGGFLQNIRIAARLNDAQILADYSLNSESSEYLVSLGTNIEEYFL